MNDIDATADHMIDKYNSNLIRHEHIQIHWCNEHIMVRTLIKSGNNIVYYNSMF